MAHYGMLRDYRFTESAEDIRGSAIYGLNNEKLGKIDDVIFDHSTGAIKYVIVDTGGWLKTKQFLVPADQLKPAIGHEGDYYADLTKTQIENFPPYDEKNVHSQEHWTDYENRYQNAWVARPVQHREGTERNITPTTGSTTSQLGQRWSNFENRLRHDRDRIVSSCNVCGQSSVTRERERKVG